MSFEETTIGTVGRISMNLFGQDSLNMLWASNRMIHPSANVSYTAETRQNIELVYFASFSFYCLPGLSRSIRIEFSSANFTMYFY